VEIGGKLLTRKSRGFAPLNMRREHKIHNYNCNRQGSFYLFFKNKFIPCCDDERCGSVENLRKPLRRQLVVTEVVCASHVRIPGYLRQVGSGAGPPHFSSSRSNRISAAFAKLVHNRQSERWRSQFKQVYPCIFDSNIFII
jgi:hypothetical protein